jgi:hypothetical protein
MRYLSITNHKKHQHYKDRRPPWIKLHVEVLDDYAFGCLQDASKAHLMLLWVLASKLDNRIPYDLGWISQQLNISTPIDVEELVAQGFIEVSEDDSKPLAFRKQSAMPETETEGETEKRKKKHSTPDGAGSKSFGWVSEGAEWWAKNVGTIAPPRFGKTLKPAVDLHTWAKVFPAMKCYVEETKSRGKPTKLEWFAAEIVRWVEWAGMPATDEKGDLTPRGKAILGLSA